MGRARLAFVLAAAPLAACLPPPSAAGPRPPVSVRNAIVAVTPDAQTPGAAWVTWRDTVGRRQTDSLWFCSRAADGVARCAPARFDDAAAAAAPLPATPPPWPSPVATPRPTTLTAPIAPERDD